MTQNLFSYGTLQDVAVQMSVFNRKLTGRKDAIGNYKISKIQILDEEVLAISRLTHHLILVPGEPEDIVHGMVFEITDEELVRADEYESEDYQRVLVPTLSGGEAWVYVGVNKTIELT